MNFFLEGTKIDRIVKQFEVINDNVRSKRGRACQQFVASLSQLANLETSYDSLAICNL